MARASLRDELVDNLENQVDTLRAEIASLRKTLGKRGAKAYDEASQSAGAFYDDMSERWADALPHIRKRARYVEQQARENPGATVAIALVAVGVLAALLARR
ncbi:hypothetical protein DRY87_26290 [Salmonella enterica subsp. enterica serovar Newport]|nr:hypothetical protein [Salmonella enterica subsp. enterica serovar Newport]